MGRRGLHRRRLRGSLRRSALQVRVAQPTLEVAEHALGGSCPCDCYIFLCKAVDHKRPTEEAAGASLCRTALIQGLPVCDVTESKGSSVGSASSCHCVPACPATMAARSLRPAQGAVRIAREGLHSHLSPGVRPALGGLGSRSLMLRPLQGCQLTQASQKGGQGAGHAVVTRKWSFGSLAALP